MTKSPSPFPKLSQAWRIVRLGSSCFAVSALTGLEHLVWSERTAIVAVVVAAGEAAYRQVCPSGALSGQLASLVAAYRQIKAATATPAPAGPVVEHAEAPPAA